MKISTVKARDSVSTGLQGVKVGFSKRGDPFVLATASELDHPVERVNVVAGPPGLGQSIMTVTSNGSIVSSATTAPPGLRPLSTEVCEVGPSLSLINELIE